MQKKYEYRLRAGKEIKAVIEKSISDPPTWWVRLGGHASKFLQVRDEEVALATLRLQMEDGDILEDKFGKRVK